jgi:nitrogen fixation/metabolism regulation signal transduction histidine kinase
MITAAHLRIRSETGANLPMLVLAIVAAGAVFVTFVFTTLIHEPASIVTLLAIVALSIGLGARKLSAVTFGSALRLAKRRLEGCGVDAEKKVALLHHLPFLEHGRNQRPIHLWFYGDDRIG